ncbi:hypothetical protein ACS6F6_07590 [Enterobacter hormaechei subsp. steigerwaltii]|uniref:hypothetical protein n=1 Tax=Enterobacter hormaechei TaxID=158836 RepID=UPI003F441312
MTERGMIFNGEMVRAILDGRKTQTRRIMKVQPDTPEFGLRRIIESSIANEIGMYFWSQEDARGIKARSKQFSCPYGDVGDRIWVRETFQGPLFDFEEMEAYQDDSSKFKRPEFCVYKADGKPAPEFFDADENLHCCWRPSIHMPRWASRITLEITGVRVEQLNDISEEDARSEGISGSSARDVKEAYAALWRSIYGSDSWRANPWVWVIEFKRIEGDGHATD